MATIAELLIKLGMDDGGLDKGMSSSQSKLKSWGESLKKTGDWMKTRVTLPLVAAGGLALKWASDLDQAMGKSEAVFGDQTKTVEEWSKGTAKAFGFARSESIGMAATYGSLFKVIGQTNEVAADQSMTLVELAADMAAFNDVSNSRASEALMAGLTGEYTSLKFMGVFLNEAAVNQEALTLAQAEGREEITEADKVQARYNLIMKQTAQQQGQAAREAKNFASRMAQVRAQAKDLGATFGNLLMPHFLGLLDVLEKLIDWLGDLDPKWQKIILAVAAFAAALGPALIALGFMLPAIGALATVLGLLLSPIGLVIVAIAALIGLGIYAWANDLWGVRDAVDAAIDAFGRFADGLDAFRKYIQFVLEDGDLMNDWLTHLPEVLQPIVMMLGQVALALQDFWAMMGPVLGDFYDALQALGEGDWREVLDELQEAFLGLGEALSTLGADILQILADYFNDLSDSAGALGPTLSALSLYFSEAADGMRHLADAFSDALDGDWAGFFTNIGLAVFDLVQSLGSLSLAFGELALAAIGALADGLQTAWERDIVPWIQGRGAELLTEANTWALGMVQKGSDFLQGLLDGMTQKIPVIQAWLLLLGPVLLAAVGDFLTTLLQKGMDLLTGLLDGMIQRLPTLQAWLMLLGSVAFAAVGDVTKSLLQKGKDLISGIIDGFNERWEQAKYWLSLVYSYARSNIGDVTSSLKQKGLDLIQGLWTGMIEKWQSAQSWLATIRSSASGAIGDLGSVLWAAGASLMQGLWDGAKSVWESVAGWLAEKRAEIEALKGPPREDAKVLIRNGQLIMQGLGVGMAEGWSGIERQLEGYSAGLDGMMSGGLGGAAGSGSGPVYNVQVVTLEPGRWKEFLDNAMAGGEFANNFGAQMGLYAGTP